MNEMYEDIEEKLNNGTGKDSTVVMGYWSASVAEGREGNCAGKYVLRKRSDRGQKQVDFCRRQEMVVANTWFQQIRRQYT